MLNIPKIKLSDGHSIPQFGLGVYRMKPGEETKNACLKAFEIGYRHIDTAHIYLNERDVGKAMKESGIKRNEFFLTSKLWMSDYGEKRSEEAINKMLERLDTSYLDLLLLHQPLKDYCGAWKAMEKAVKAGKIRSIGVSNFTPKSLDRIMEIQTIKPVVNQIQCHPYHQQVELREYLKKIGVRVESWFPIGGGDKKLINEPIFSKIGAKYHKTNAQIILRWHIQEGFIVFPKAINAKHQKENIDIFDFQLTEEEMKEIRKIDKKKKYFPIVDYIPWIFSLFPSPSD